MVNDNNNKTSRSYNYIREHMEEYTQEYQNAKNELLASIIVFDKTIPSDIVVTENDIHMFFHYALIKSGKEKKPVTCLGCPFLLSDFLPNGSIQYTCVKNVDWYIGDCLFPLRYDNRPEWCPLDKKG